MANEQELKVFRMTISPRIYDGYTLDHLFRTSRTLRSFEDFGPGINREDVVERYIKAHPKMEFEHPKSLRVENLSEYYTYHSIYEIEEVKIPGFKIAVMPLEEKVAEISK